MVIRKVINATPKANQRTSLPSPLSGMKGTIKALVSGKSIDKDNQGIFVKSAPNFPSVPKWKTYDKRRSITSSSYFYK